MASKQETIAIKDFDKAIQQLEALVQTLDKGDLSLEAALKQFESGVALARQCQSVLQQAEQKVQTLIEEKDS